MSKPKPFKISYNNMEKKTKNWNVLYEKCKDFDDVLELVGGEGRFQLILLFAIMCPIITLQPFFVLNTIFMLYVPNHWCHIPLENHKNLSLEEFKSHYLPKEIGPDGNERFSQCKMFDSSSIIRGESLSEVERKIVDCQYGWDYDRTDFIETIPSEFNWTCLRASYATDALTFCAIGNAIGTIVFGHLADRVGRKPIFYTTLLINIILRMISLFIPQHIYGFMTIQFLIGTSFPAMFISITMIVAETCGKRFRSLVYSCSWIIWVGGMGSLPYFAWLSAHWFYLGLITSLPGLLLLLYYPFIPESPRWLVSVGKVREACKIVTLISKTNGKLGILGEDEIELLLKNIVQLQSRQNALTGKIGILTLFSKSRLAKKTIMLTISWSMNTIIYYGITLNTSNLNGSQFVNFFLLSLIELPSSFLGGYLVDKLGRRWTQVGFFFISVIFSGIAGVGVSEPSLSFLVLISVFVAKFAITLTYLVVYLQGAEIFPTQLRSTGNGFAAAVAQGIAVFGPYLIYLGQYIAAAPYFVLAILSCLGMMASLFLPETFKQPLPETIQDANDFGKNNKFWSFRTPPITKRGQPKL